MKDLKTVRRLLLFFIVALFLSGLTAIPVDTELHIVKNWFPPGSALRFWLTKVLNAYTEVKAQHPFLLYGYAWLAFAHFVLAFLFIGPYRNPVKNIWVIQFGLMACVAILPFAFVAGYFRGIPFGWRLIDCFFGIVGFAVLFVCYRKIIRYAAATAIKTVNI